MNTNRNISRRAFIGGGIIGGAALAVGGGAVAWLAARRRGSASDVSDRFLYDTAAFETTDPALLLYQPAGGFATGLTEPTCLAAGHDKRLLVGGDQQVLVCDDAGRVLSRLALDGVPRDAQERADGAIVVALRNRIVVYRRDGTLLADGGDLGRRTLLTAIALAGNDIFAADAGHREIIRCDERGRAVARFGRRAMDADAANPGFVVPSPYFDIAWGADDLLRVVNPGRHRIEAYTRDGGFEFAWGESSMAVQGFCGCCNPVYITMLADGGFVTSEKGLSRVKRYDPEGRFLGVVAGPESLVKDPELARRACVDCTVGFGFGVAADAAGRVFVLDPLTREVRIFVPKGGVS